MRGPHLLCPLVLITTLQGAEPALSLKLGRAEHLDLLTWQAIPGASRYAVFAFQQGRPHPVWIWTGTGTSVAVGDPLDPALTPLVRLARAQTPDPSLTPASRLEFVALAFDARGDLLRTMPRRPL